MLSLEGDDDSDEFVDIPDMPSLKGDEKSKRRKRIKTLDCKQITNQTSNK